MIRGAVETLLECYPKVFLACHRTHVRDEGSGRELSAHRARVLDHLDAVEPMHLHTLAAHLGVTPSSMSLMIDRLEKSGHVRRSRDAGDGRRVNLRLTSAGVRVRNQQKILDPSLVEGMLRRLAPAERSAALGGLRALARAADELMAGEHYRRVRGRSAS